MQRNVREMNYIDYHKTQVAANIDLTYKCNLGCTQCMRYIMEKPTEKGSTARVLFQHKLQNSYDIPLIDLEKIVSFFNLIGFCGGLSDPVFYRYFDDLLEMCKSYKNKKFTIHTAATQKNIQWYEKVFDNTPKNITWVMGLDGLADTSALYRRRQNSQLMYDAMLLGSEKNVKIDWQYIVFPYNLHQIDQAKDIAKNNNMNLTLVYSNRDENGKMIQGLDVRRERFKFRIDRK